MRKISLYILTFLCFFYSCEEVLFEEDLSDKKTVLIAPSNDTTVETTAVTFSWEAVDQATEYHLQLALPDFENTNQIVIDTVVTTTNYNATLTKNSYQWKVRGQNAGSATPYTTASFKVIESEDFSSREVILIAPENNNITNTTTPNLQWQVVTDATLYRVQLLNESNEIINEETTSTASVSPTFPEGVTKWQVRAENNTQSTLYATRTVTVDSKNPKQPMVTAPANDATLSGTTVTFSWTREAVAGTTEFDKIYIYTDEDLTQLVTEQEATSPADIDLTAGATYYWIVRAFDQAGNQSETSTKSKFTINP
ncbi:hypothetical protein ABW636_20310 [Aquimarina sp. 2201CG1-2-11]|uniref:hypothetical protein n=1 Tax=Aquimarina discodermiae TaxID=3231043 RepID=UPI0034629FC6